MLTRADKGKTIVILDIYDYNKKNPRLHQQQQFHDAEYRPHQQIPKECQKKSQTMQYVHKQETS